MKFSIITAVLNRNETISRCIESVLGQTYPNIEYIIIDGGSTDGTKETISRYATNIARYVSERDNGMYNALNKGISLATGDIVGFLHSDDQYENWHTIMNIASAMSEAGADACYGDLVYVYKDNAKKVLRYWKSGPYSPGLFKNGWMPPHPTLFLKREIYGKHGGFNTDFKIAADYELMLRMFVKHGISSIYMQEVIVRMSHGGKSNMNLKNILIKTAEDYKAWKVNGLSRNIWTIPLKNLSKLPQFLSSP